MGITANVFMASRSMAVRVPKEFRLELDEVRIRKEGNAVILEPIPGDWSCRDGVVRPVDVDIRKAVAERSNNQMRPGLDRLE